jgi:ketosteroid isomerase-like protein
VNNAPFRRAVPRPASPLLLCGLLLTAGCRASDEGASKQAIEELVWQHAKAWETGDAALFERIIHPDIVFAYPGGRLGKPEIMGSFNDFARDFKDTRVYVHKILIQGDEVAVEWQFASTERQSGKRSAVSDGIIGRVKEGRFILWKEYFDPSVASQQADGGLALEEGQEPFPWPAKN